MAIIRCRICGYEIDIEHPTEGGRAINPNTMRWGWVHNWCLVEEIGQMTKDRKEAYDDKVRAEVE